MIVRRMKTKSFLILGCLVAGVGALNLHAADWPQYRGPNHDGVSSEKILTTWPAGGPRQLWKTPLTDGFSSLTVGGGRAFTLVTREADGADQEMCVALDANTGKELWAAPLGIAKYDGGGDSGTEENSGGDGPRSTPSVDGDRVYTMSARLFLKCLEAGQWKRGLDEEFAQGICRTKH